ncbi:hypothetical protein CT1651 [Chlorobaculum tepidum TLS]|uniref:Uncharacterized protein n=1 Tax=Chlorobaculum tepidum (strain ATCC 49652 / DSM 12025 / NBRC 103806 / TLS) TaxID=194439 RepID=Q8KBY1_CHLTE|nr:hypothetical protein CT1651 [Chlorobaculum tepidum TLS]
MLEMCDWEENASGGGNFLRSERTELIDSEDWPFVCSVAIGHTVLY